MCSEKCASEKPRMVLPLPPLSLSLSLSFSLSLCLPPSSLPSHFLSIFTYLETLIHTPLCSFFVLAAKGVFLSSFVTSPEGHAPALKGLSVQAMQAHTVRHTQNVVKRTLLVAKLHEQWRAYTRLALSLWTPLGQLSVELICECPDFGGNFAHLSM